MIIDGYVWLGEQRRDLGAHLYEALDKQATINGVGSSRRMNLIPKAGAFAP